MPTDEHLDANLLSSFTERSLLAGERAQVLQHLSLCSSCRELVAMSLPAQSEMKAVAQQHKVTVARPLLIKAAWSLLAVCVVAITTMMLVRHQNQSARSVVPQRQLVNDYASGPGQAAQANSAPPQPPIQQSGKNVPLDSPQLARPRETEATTLMAEAKPQEEIVPGRAKDSVATPDQSSSAAVTGNYRPLHSVRTAPRWILGSDGTLQRSLDSGASWQFVSVSKGVTLHALAANGMDIWVGGTRGALFHSGDAGRHWVRVQPVHAGQTLEADIIGVEFTDSAHGTVMTSSKEIWTTADAGESWEKK